MKSLIQHRIANYALVLILGLVPMHLYAQSSTTSQSKSSAVKKTTGATTVTARTQAGKAPSAAVQTGKSSKSTIASKSTLVNKSTTKKAPPAVAKAHKSSSENDYKMVSVNLYSKLGNLPVSSIPGIAVSESLIAVHLDRSIPFSDIASQYRLNANLTPMVSLHLVDIDLASRWALLKATSRMNVQLPNKSASKTISDRTAVAVGARSGVQALEDLNQLGRNYLRQRATASDNSSAAAVIGNKLAANGDGTVESLAQSRLQIRSGDMVLAPQFEHFRCRPSSLTIEAKDVQEMVAAGTSLRCDSERRLEIAPGLEQALKMHLGVIAVGTNQSSDDNQRSHWIQEIAQTELNDLKKFSNHIHDSTPITCTASYLSDTHVDVYFCTRGLRVFPSLADSVIIMGRRSGQNYLVSMLRASGFSSRATKSMTQLLLSALESNHD